MSAFNPADWLNRFEAAGGGWYVTEGRPTLCAIEGAKVADIIAETCVPGRTDAVFAAILDRHSAKEMHGAE